MNVNKFLLRVIEHYTPEKQIMVFLGEIGELQCALSTGIRSDIIDELADSTIMLHQRFLITGVEDICGIEKPSGINLQSIVRQILKYEGRLAQGREYKVLPLFMFSGWIHAKTVSMGIEKEVKERVRYKLKRLKEKVDGK